MGKAALGFYLCLNVVACPPELREAAPLGCTGVVGGCECRARGACPAAPAGFALSPGPLSRAAPVRPCMYWAQSEARPRRAQRLVDAASASAESNARTARRLLSLQLPPEHQFRTRCLTFANSVLVEAAGDKAAAVRILQEHCQEQRSGLQVAPVDAAAAARCLAFAEAFVAPTAWQSAAAVQAWCTSLYRGAPRAALLARRVFFREVVLGAPHGAAALEAAMRCAPDVIATQVGTLGADAVEAVQVVYDDPPGLHHLAAVLEAYRGHEGPTCVSDGCREAVFCTTPEQCEEAESLFEGAECLSIRGPFEPAPHAEQAVADPACAEPAPNRRLYPSVGANQAPAC